MARRARQMSSSLTDSHNPLIREAAWVGAGLLASRVRSLKRAFVRIGPGLEQIFEVFGLNGLTASASGYARSEKSESQKDRCVGFRQDREVNQGDRRGPLVVRIDCCSEPEVFDDRGDFEVDQRNPEASTEVVTQTHERTNAIESSSDGHVCHIGKYIARGALGVGHRALSA